MPHARTEESLSQVVPEGEGDDTVLAAMLQGIIDGYPAVSLLCTNATIVDLGEPYRDARPIATGEVLRRHFHGLSSALEKNGAETIIHVVRRRIRGDREALSSRWAARTSMREFLRKRRTFTLTLPLR